MVLIGGTHDGERVDFEVGRSHLNLVKRSEPCRAIFNKGEQCPPAPYAECEMYKAEEFQFYRDGLIPVVIQFFVIDGMSVLTAVSLLFSKYPEISSER